MSLKRMTIRGLAIGLAMLGCLSLSLADASAQTQKNLPPSIIGTDDEGAPYGSHSSDNTRGGEPDDLGRIPPGHDDRGGDLIFKETRFATNGVDPSSSLTKITASSSSENMILSSVLCEPK